MRTRTRTRRLGLAAVLALAAAGAAGAQGLALDGTGAALALPVITGGQPGNPLKATAGDTVIPAQTATTVVSLTNATSSGIGVHLHVVDGAPGDACEVFDFTCSLTGRETMTLVFTPTAGGSIVRTECDGAPFSAVTGVENGVLFVSVEDGQGATVSEEALFGDAIVTDTSNGLAYSVDAIAIRAGVGLNDGDRTFELDGQEYEAPRASLATNFMAPTSDGAVEAQLILFTLDFSAGVPARAALNVQFLNDDEVLFDASYTFDCFDVVALEDINPNTMYFPGPLGLGSVSGHLELRPVPSALAADVHDALFGDGNDVRTRGVYGWYVGSATTTLVPADEPIPTIGPFPVVNGPAAWGHRLERENVVLLPFLNDDFTTFRAD